MARIPVLYVGRSAVPPGAASGPAVADQTSTQALATKLGVMGDSKDENEKFQEELIGLDPHDPETKAFADHLDKMQRQGPGYTVEGYLRGVQDFADSANRTTGHQRLVAVIVVGLILLGVLLTIWFALGDILAIIF
jgi:hypothetical protein